MNFPFNLICFDLETTGTIPEKASIIQIGAVIVNEQFEIIPGLTFNFYVKPLDSFRDPNATRIHGISEQILNTSPSLDEVLIMFENFCGDNKVLGSWGNYFDVPFLFKQYEKIRRTNPFTHRSIDLKSIATWEMAKTGMGIKGGIKTFLRSVDEDFEGVQHDALDDIINAVKLLNILKKRSTKN